MIVVSLKYFQGLLGVHPFADLRSWGARSQAALEVPPPLYSPIFKVIPCGFFWLFVDFAPTPVLTKLAVANIPGAWSRPGRAWGTVQIAGGGHSTVGGTEGLPKNWMVSFYAPKAGVRLLSVLKPQGLGPGEHAAGGAGHGAPAPLRHGRRQHQHWGARAPPRQAPRGKIWYDNC